MHSTKSVQVFLIFPRVIVADFAFDTPSGFAGLLVVRLLAPLRSVFDRSTRFERFVESVLAASFATTTETAGGCISLLGSRVTRIAGGEGCGSVASTPDDNVKPSENTSGETSSRRRGGAFLFPAAFETFDEWAGPRDAFAGCPSIREPFVLLGSNVRSVAERRTRLPELGGGELDVEEERSASSFFNPAGSMSAGGSG